MLTRSFRPQERSALTGFAYNPLNRMSERRDDGAFIAGLELASGTQSLVLSGDIPVLKRAGEDYNPFFTFEEISALGTVREKAFLGHDGCRALFATLLEAEAPENTQAREDIARIDLRSLTAEGLVAAEVIGALGQAKSLMYWHSRHRFCSNCGAPSRVASAGWRRQCDACQAQHFPRTDPVAIMLVVDGDQCLLGRQARFPQNLYTCLAGFIESGETFEDAVRREVHEEAGIATGRVDYFGTQPWPFPSSLMIGGFAEALQRELTIDWTELEDARWFGREEVRLMLRKDHPNGLFCPPRLAIANLLIEAWAMAEGG
jgi:NAD+ diphosphatase